MYYVLNGQQLLASGPRLQWNDIKAAAEAASVLTGTATMTVLQTNYSGNLERNNNVFGCWPSAELEL